MINFKSITKALVITYCLGQLAACSKDYNFTPAPPPPPCDTCTPASISFKNDIVPIFTAGCKGCHGIGGAAGLDLTAANAYTSLFANKEIDTVANATTPELNKLYVKISPSGSMNVYLSNKTKEMGLILTWIKQGAKNN